MFTLRTSSPSSGTLAAKRSMMPSSGWMRSASRLASGDVALSPKSISGGSLNWMAISVARLGSRLPVRR